MDKESCRTCGHFIQHYAFRNGKFRWVNCGHCTEPKVRHKDPYAKICEHYIHTQPAEDQFLTQEYLTKELLKYVLSLDLPPKIEPLDENK